MKFERQQSATFRGEGGDCLRVHYDNRGDPYREGLTFDLTENEYDHVVSVFLEGFELRQLRDLLNKMYPILGNQ